MADFKARLFRLRNLGSLPVVKLQRFFNGLAAMIRGSVRIQLFSPDQATTAEPSSKGCGTFQGYDRGRQPLRLKIRHRLLAALASRGVIHYRATLTKSRMATTIRFSETMMIEPFWSIVYLVLFSFGTISVRTAEKSSSRSSGIVSPTL